MHFSKWQGCGNDFILIDGRKERVEEVFQFSKRICDRHYGIGADGVLFVLPSQTADFRMQIINVDGTEAEMCGNGIRCVARYLWDSGATQKERFSIETGAGILFPRILLQEGIVKAVEVDMGEPRLNAAEIPVEGYGEGRVVHQKITALDQDFFMTCVSMGNPHCVIFIDRADDETLHRFGPVLESHSAFPRKMNVEFVEIRDESHLRMRVWERGAAVTLACGTGSCATMVAAALNGRTGRSAEIELDGGKLQVHWSEQDNHVYMTGPAEFIFEGELAEEARS